MHWYKFVERVSKSKYSLCLLCRRRERQEMTEEEKQGTERRTEQTRWMPV